MVVVWSEPLFRTPCLFELYNHICYIVFLIAYILEDTAIADGIVFVLLIAYDCSGILYHVIVDVQLVDEEVRVD